MKAKRKRNVPKFDNVQPAPNPKPMTVFPVQVRVINRELSARMGFDVYGESTSGYLRDKPLQ